MKFGLIINEFGSEGVDGQLVEGGEDEKIVELSNGCVCCVVREDLIEAARKIVEQGQVDYIILETSGLAEPMPVAQTFALDDLDGKVMLDAVVCVIDAQNYKMGMENFEVGITQLQAADIVVINKLDEAGKENLDEVLKVVKEVNPFVAVIKNEGDLDTSLLLAAQKWSVDRLLEAGKEYEAEDNHDDNDHGHEHHHHEHDDVDEVLFSTLLPINMEKLNDWFVNNLPDNVVRAKGIVRMEIFPGQYGTFLLQMVGATRQLVPFIYKRKSINPDKSTIVLMGKDLNEGEILEGMQNIIA